MLIGRYRMQLLRCMNKQQNRYRMLHFECLMKCAKKYQIQNGTFAQFSAQESPEKPKNGSSQPSGSLFSLLPLPKLSPSQKKLSSASLWLSLFVAFNSYLGYAIYYHVTETERGAKGDMAFCDGIGLVLIITLVVYISLGIK